jgi:hypothetical protein
VTHCNFNTGDQGLVIERVTAIIKVKDSPGALWNALHKIGVSIYSRTSE